MIALYVLIFLLAVTASYQAVTKAAEPCDVVACSGLLVARLEKLLEKKKQTVKREESV